jgi:eukaryotic-like serine/threonine-protein kinase
MTSDRLATALADRYQIERDLGAGGMATVYLAQDLKHRRRVALKVLKPELSAVLGGERFLNEITVTANLAHPHILQLYDSGEAVGLLYYVMPFIEGPSLRDRLREERQLSLEDAIRITQAIAGALDFAHRRGVIHRDIKPENILLQDGVPLLADFGIALAVHSAGGERLTETGLSLGTPAYMSPEQIAGEHDVDARSDVYALACVTYEMLAGDPPFTASNAQAVLAKHMADVAPSITTTRPDAVPAVAHALAKALRKAPADRYASAGAFAAALSAEAAPDEGNARSLVVLPFVNQSPDPDNEYFADGLTEEIIGDLSRLRGLRVISRNSAMALKGTRKDTPTLARELHVSHVVTGSVRRAGNALRVSAELVEAASDTPVWSDKYSGTLEDVFGIQEEIARKVVGALQMRLTDSEQGRVAERPVGDVVAYDCYLRARQAMYAWTPESMARAERLIDQALGIVGDNPLLLAMRGQISWMFVNVGIRPDPTLLDRAREYVDRALALDPDHYLAVMVRGALAAQRGEVEFALEDVHRAVLLQPGDPNVLTEMCRFLLGAGLPNATYRDELVRVDPLTPVTWLVSSDLIMGRFSSVAPSVHRLVELAGAVSPLHILAAAALAVAGGREEAIAMMDQAGQAFRGSTTGSWASFLKHAYLEDAAGAAAHLTPELQQAAALVDHNARSMAEGCALIGRIDDAVRWIEIAISRSLVAYPFFTKYDPLLANVRQDERFQRLMADLRPRWEALVAWYRGTFGWTGPIE